MQLYTASSPEPCADPKNIKISSKSYSNQLEEYWIFGQVLDGRTCKVRISSQPDLNAMVKVNIQYNQLNDAKLFYMKHD